MSAAGKRFRIALSFAGETRDYVAGLASQLAAHFGEAAILYDRYHQAEFARRDLGFYLARLYQEESDLVVVVISPEYEPKQWCGLEWAAIFDLLAKRKDKKIMLCRFERATVSGLYDTAGFVELDDKTPEQAATLVLERLALNEGRPKNHYTSGARSADREWQPAARPRYFGPPLRKLDPIVLVNRREEITALADFLSAPSPSLLFLVGLPGIGKSTLARGVLEKRPKEVTALWITCEGLTIDVLLTQLNSAFELDADNVLRDAQASSLQRTGDVLNRMQSLALVVLDGLEALLREDGEFQSKEIGEFVRSVVELDHAVKVLATTRRVPAGYGKGSSGSDSTKLGGLAITEAKHLFRVRAGMTEAQLERDIPQQVFETLHGHPKFIELLAMAVHEIPLAQLVKRVLEASDIGEYVRSEVITRLDEEERRLLAAAVVFRQAFSYEALAHVHAALHDGVQPAASAVRSLVRRAILDRTEGENYFLHPILGEAMTLSADEAARAHAAAAQHLLPDPVDPADRLGWEEGLFHLRRAAELGQNETHFRRYYEFVARHWGAWNWAGWPRRSVDELRAVAALATEPGDIFLSGYQLSLALDKAGDREEALQLIRNLVTEMEQLPKHPVTEREKGLCGIAAIVKLRIGLISVGPGSVDEARQMADDVEPWIEALGDTHLRHRYCQLRFQIARREEPLNPEKMLVAAEDYLAAVEDWLREQSDPQSRDTLAEAYFAMGLSNLFIGNFEEGLKHLGTQLEIKRQLGNMPGVAAGLWTFGLLGRQASVAGAGAAVLASDQMSREMGIAQHTDKIDVVREAVEGFRADQSQLLKGRALIERVAPEAIPFYERGLAYWGLAELPAAAT